MTSTTITRLWLSAVRVEAVQGFGGEGHGGIEAEGDGGLVEVVVDGLGHAHRGRPLLEQGWAMVREPSPPMEIRASSPSFLKLAWPGQDLAWMRLTSPWPVLAANRPLLVVPRMVPPTKRRASISL